MSEMHEYAEEYLAARRSLGHKLDGHGRLLLSFVEHLEALGAEQITVDLAIEWATLPRDVQPAWWSQRLSVVRCFAKHLAAIDPRTEIPPADVLRARPQRAAPHLYSPDEVKSLMAEAAGIRFPLRAYTYETLIGLLASSGLRVGEAIRLQRSDVDLAQGLITIRESKFRKSRLVPLHPTTTTALLRYASRRDELMPHPRTDNFFLSLVGSGLHHSDVNLVFRNLVRRIGLERPGKRRPRPHDLRHTFALEALLGWYRAGEDVAPRLAALSTYLGHVKPSSTYWYFQAAPELLALAAECLETQP
jgi:integrase